MLSHFYPRSAGNSVVHAGNFLIYAGKNAGNSGGSAGNAGKSWVPLTCARTRTRTHTHESHAGIYPRYPRYPRNTGVRKAATEKFYPRFTRVKSKSYPRKKHIAQGGGAAAPVDSKAAGQ